MTTSKSDDDAIGDPHFDSAWRAASRETPAVALDDAIRAAARREVSAGPAPLRRAAKVREATRPEKWWGPLAAAAVIGSIAVGVLQLAPQDRDPAADAAKAIVSDVPADSGAARRNAPKPVATPAPAAVGESTTAAAPAAATATAPPPAPAATAATAANSLMDAKTKAEPPLSSANQQMTGATSLQKSLSKNSALQESATRGGAMPSSAAGLAAAPAASEAVPPRMTPEPERQRKQQDSAARAETGAEKTAAPSTPRPAPQPFPAQTDKRSSAANMAQAQSAAVDAAEPDVRAKDEVFADAPRKSVTALAAGALTANATAPRSAPAPAAAAAPAAARASASTSLPSSAPAESDAMRDRLAAAPPPVGALDSTQAAGGAVARARSDAPSFAASPPAMPQRETAAEPARQLPMAKVAAERRLDAAVDAKAKERARLPVADWIALIRKLRDAGRQDEMALELKAFRAVHADAQTLLPADLRDVTTPMR
jgi:hypothetical protein